MRNLNADTNIPNLYVLAGGQSSRFGSDKALADMGGIPLLKDVIIRLKHDDQHAIIVSGDIKPYEHLGYPVITDDPTGVGPLGGLSAALSHRIKQHGKGWIMLASCDLVYPRRQWLERLVARLTNQNQSVIAFRGERWEPMFALYHTNTLPQIQHQLQYARYSLQHLLDSVAAIAVDLPDGMTSIPQANTPEQLKALSTRSIA